jgi:hypothetical protein
MRMFPAIFAGLAVSVTCLQLRVYAQDDQMRNRIARATLNQNVPAVIKVGTNGVTTLEFPYKIEAIDSYGFSPMPSAGDGFQIWYTKGTNFFSVRALKPGVTGNLTVVLDQKVYSLFFQESSEPSFVAIFEPAGAGRLEASNDSKCVEVATPAQLASLIDKAKSYSALRTNSPQLLAGFQMAEPEKKNSIGNGVEAIIHRVIRDASLDSVVFDVEINNRSSKDFLYDPEGFKVRVNDQVYVASTVDAAGIVKAQTNDKVFIAVTGTATGARNDLTPENDFDLLVREVTASRTNGTTFNEPPHDFVPTELTVARAGKQSEPVLSKEHRSTKQEAPQVALNQAGSKQAAKKTDPKPQNKGKDSVAKNQKPPPRKLFGWL